MTMKGCCMYTMTRTGWCIYIDKDRVVYICTQWQWKGGVYIQWQGQGGVYTQWQGKGGVYTQWQEKGGVYIQWQGQDRCCMKFKRILMDSIKVKQSSSKTTEIS